MSASTAVQTSEGKDSFVEDDVGLWKDLFQTLSPTFQGYFQPITVQEWATQARHRVTSEKFEEDHFVEYDVKLWNDFYQNLPTTFQSYLKPITVQTSTTCTGTRYQVPARTSSGWKIGRLIRYLRKRLHAMKCSKLNNSDFS
jgi:hypothetical protein